MSFKTKRTSSSEPRVTEQINFTKVLLPALGSTAWFSHPLWISRRMGPISFTPWLVSMLLPWQREEAISFNVSVSLPISQRHYHFYLESWALGSFKDTALYCLFRDPVATATKFIYLILPKLFINTCLSHHIMFPYIIHPLEGRGSVWYIFLPFSVPLIMHATFFLKYNRMPLRRFQESWNNERYIKIVFKLANFLSVNLFITFRFYSCLPKFQQSPCKLFSEFTKFHCNTPQVWITENLICCQFDKSCSSE